MLLSKRRLDGVEIALCRAIVARYLLRESKRQRVSEARSQKPEERIQFQCFEPTALPK